MEMFDNREGRSEKKEGRGDGSGQGGSVSRSNGESGEENEPEIDTMRNLEDCERSRLSHQH